MKINHEHTTYNNRNMEIFKLLLLILIYFLSESCSNSNQGDYSDLVKPMIGTDWRGHTFPGSVLPFGIVS